MAISVLKVVPLEAAESVRLAAADALTARLAAEEKAERAKHAAEEALDAWRAAHEALVAQLAEAGWRADGRDDTWFGQTFRLD